MACTMLSHTYTHSHSHSSCKQIHCVNACDMLGMCYVALCCVVLGVYIVENPYENINVVVANSLNITVKLLATVLHLIVYLIYLAAPKS